MSTITWYTGDEKNIEHLSEDWGDDKTLCGLGIGRDVRNYLHEARIDHCEACYDKARSRRDLRQGRKFLRDGKNGSNTWICDGGQEHDSKIRFCRCKADDDLSLK